MSSTRRIVLLMLVVVGAGRADGQTGDPIRIGMEYILIDNAPRVDQVAKMMATTGATAAKHYAEHAEWDAMQPSAAAPIDFRRLDAFVRAFQAQGFRNLVICLRSRSRWASRKFALLGTQDISPKPEYLEAYGRWIGAVVERYDGDGKDDMPGLTAPVSWYEIGSEFSTYESEPVEEYLAMLSQAYHAAHGAFAGVKVAHAAFLTTNAFAAHPAPERFDAAFAAVDKRIMYHDLAAIRKILDRGDLFDAINIHSLGDPSEIEEMVSWLAWEMTQRGYHKPILMSDTATTPFIAWGAAITCIGPRASLGVIVAPATEADRCRLAAYFTRLVDGDAATVKWTQEFAATDLVKRVVIAAEQRIVLINTAFVEDLTLLKLKVFRAGTGPSAWAGMIDLGKQQRRPAFTALTRVAGWLKDYEAIRRVPMAERDVRLYEIRRGTAVSWIGWIDPQRVVLPGDPAPTREIALPVAGQVAIEPAIDGVMQPQVVNGRIRLTLVPASFRTR